MISHLRQACNPRLVACLCASGFIFFFVTATSSLAAPINYGDFGPDPPGVTMYLQVTESSATDPVPPGRYGPPELDGDLLDFDPTEFVAFATSGNSDITDVQLNYTMMTVPGAALQSFQITERGDYTLFGGGTAATQVAAGVIAQVDILAVDGVMLDNPVDASNSASILLNLDDDAGIVQPWSNSVVIDFLAALNSAEIPFELGVTKASIVINDQLLALSEPGSVAFIAKKDFAIRPTIVPEPSSLAIMALGLAGCGVMFRRRILRSLPSRGR